MDALIPYSIPVKGLRLGVHTFKFQIDDAFFQHFEQSPVQQGQVDLTLTLDKRPDMYILEFDFEGSVKTECDRCLAPIDLPIGDAQQLMVKFSEEEEPEDAEVVFIHPEAQQLNVARYIYEFICLAIPMIRVYDCKNDPKRPCNEEMLRYLDNAAQTSDEPAPDEPNPMWEALKKWTENDN
ncbi:MAG: DUF177 domain-containing protein [Saprospiraceae bacterium]|nr:DUF177 domain-containing protein [Saprospiraceae bacterium]